MTIIAIVVAYTVPQMWSSVVKRDRDRQTLFVMKQYARAIERYQAAHGFPTTLDQLKQARKPRLVRGVRSEWVDPLTGKVDWILIPPGASQPAGPVIGGGGTPVIGGGGTQLPGQPPVNQGVAPGQTTGTGGTGSIGTSGTTDTAPVGAQNLGAPGYVGPFIGVRPNKKGKSYLLVNAAEQYEKWAYTVNQLQAERNSMFGVQSAVPGAPGTPAAPGVPAPAPTPK